jgi:hypothetical protein
LYLCPHCHQGQFPADAELDIEPTAFSPGVRRMQALVGQEAPFDPGRQQMKVLAGLEVTAKSVERTAEAMGADIAEGEQSEIRRAVQLDLPVILGQPIPFLYVANGRDRGAGGEERDGGRQRQNRRPAGPHARSQTGLRLHPDCLG